MQSSPKWKWRSTVLAVSCHVHALTCSQLLRTFSRTLLVYTVTQVRGCGEVQCSFAIEVALPSPPPSLAIRKRKHQHHPTTQPGRQCDMAQPQDDTISKIRAYSKNSRELHDNLMELDASDTEARLAQTVRELQARVEEQQAALETV